MLEVQSNLEKVPVFLVMLEVQSNLENVPVFLVVLEVQSNLEKVPVFLEMLSCRCQGSNSESAPRYVYLTFKGMSL